MHRSLVRFIALATLAAVTACDNPAATKPYPIALQPYDLRIGTDAAVYSLASDEAVRITLTNHSPDDVHLFMGVYVVFERLRDGEWVDPGAWLIVDGIGRTFAVAPGVSHRDVLPLVYLRGRPGIHRVRYYAYADPAATTLLPLEERVSTPFVIVP